MTYFREFPDIEYLSPLPHRTSSFDYVRAKNLFRRVKLRDDLQNVFTLYDKYIINDGARPDTVAEELYGSAEYDWVVLVSANITRVRDQWPLSDRDIYRFSEEKYGIEGINTIKFYETTEVKDPDGKIILPAGKVVDSNFKISYSYDGKVYTNDSIISGATVLINNPVVGITNYEYEVRKNNDKRLISVLRPQYLQQYLNDFRREMHYSKSSQYVDNKLIRTENTRNTSP